MPRYGVLERARKLAEAALTVDAEEDDEWGVAEGLGPQHLAVPIASEAPEVEVAAEAPSAQAEAKAVPSPAAGGWAAATEPKMGKDTGQGYYQALMERRRAREAQAKEEEDARWNEYVADNGQLRAKAPGITLRFSKKMEDRDEESPLVRWGTVISGVDEGDGWLKLESGRYLPVEVMGMRVMTLRSRYAGCIAQDSGQQNAAEMEERLRKRERAMRRQMARARRRSVDFYGLLGLPRHATQDNINQAYIALSRLYSPDKAAPGDEQGREARRKHMALLSQAHQVLSDVHSRVSYDCSLADRPPAGAGPQGDPAAAPRRKPRRESRQAEVQDFDFSGPGRPFRLAHGRASRVLASSGSSARKEHLRLAMRQLRGQEKMEIAERRGVVRPVGHFSPFSSLGECGLPECFANRFRRPEVRGKFRDFIVDRIRDAQQSGTGWWGSSGLRYTSLGSGQLLFDAELLERIRQLGVRIDQVCLVDQEYRAPRPAWKAALREFADWQRVAAESVKEEPAEILAFGLLCDYNETSKPGGRAAGCHLMVHCDAHWEGAFEDCERLARTALVTGGLLARLATGDGEWRPSEGVAVGWPSEAARRGTVAAVFNGDPAEGEEESWATEPEDVHGNGPCTTAAWTCEPFPKEACRLPALLSVDDPRLSPLTKSVAWRRAEEHGLAVWKVVHEPRIAARQKPSTQAKVMDVFFTGDELVVSGETSGPWLRLSELTWPDMIVPKSKEDEKDEAAGEVWVLSDGTSIGLGTLLLQVYDPVAAQVRRERERKARREGEEEAAAAEEDSAEDSDSSDDIELLTEGA